MVMVSAVFAYRAYIAWFRPEQHRNYLQRLSRIYTGWDSPSEAWMSSVANFWVMRFVFLLGFFISLIGVAVMINKTIR